MVTSLVLILIPYEMALIIFVSLLAPAPVSYPLRKQILFFFSLEVLCIFWYKSSIRGAICRHFLCLSLSIHSLNRPCTEQQCLVMIKTNVPILGVML